MQIVAVSPQAKDRLFKSVRRYLTDFAAGERPRDFELCTSAKGEKPPLPKGGWQKSLIFDGGILWRDFELPFWLRLAFVPTQVSGSAKTLSFSPLAKNIGESRTSIHHVEKEKEMDRCPSLFLGPSGET